MGKSVQIIEIDSEQEGQRLDNLLRVLLKNVPKSARYRLIRTGQVRVNSKRCKPMYRVAEGDLLRLPPVSGKQRGEVSVPESVITRLRDAVIHQDDAYLVLDKPPGLAVHGGSGLAFGVIDAVQAGWRNKGISLAHRLDRETSGCLVLAMNREAQRQFETLQQGGGANKRYFTLVRGHWPQAVTEVDMALSRSQLQGGERMVVPDPAGKQARSIFRVLERYRDMEFVEVEILTGRTHQIRVHAAASGHPLAGDEKYGDRAFNRRMRALGLERLFLHAGRVDLPAADNETLPVHAPLPDALRRVLDALQAL